MERENILQARDLCYTYDGDHRALNGVSMDIAAGERIAVMGSNGAGKSTFFLHLNGVLRADSGAVLCRGREVTDRAVHELRRRVGIVFQNADDQIIASTVGQEVAFGPMNLKLPKEEVLSRTEEALACLNLSAYRDRPPHYLSGGEKKRVSIADIIAMHPERGAAGGGAGPAGPPGKDHPPVHARRGLCLPLGGAGGGVPRGGDHRRRRDAAGVSGPGGAFEGRPAPPHAAGSL